MQVTLKTNKGEIELELDTEKAPVTTENFLQYVRDGFYDGTIFHRVIPNFMIQGGGFTEDMQQKATREPIENEAGNGLSNEIGAIAMARTPDPHSASAQFFINVGNNRFLDRDQADDGWGYAVFGRVVAGMDVVEAIKQVPTGNAGMHQNVPTQPVKIEKAEIKE
jgi:peptidyl-prolyl cis-trans isomerase B (cyclophilin B)